MRYLKNHCLASKCLNPFRAAGETISPSTISLYLRKARPSRQLTSLSIVGSSASAHRSSVVNMVRPPRYTAEQARQFILDGLDDSDEEDEGSDDSLDDPRHDMSSVFV